MVAQRKIYTGSAPLIHLVRTFVIALSAIILGACDSNSAQTVVKLHFKQPASIIQALENNLEERTDFHVVDNSIVFHAPEKEITKTLALLKTLDQPPAAYKLHLEKKNIKRYSTTFKPSTISLIEDLATELEINKLKYNFLVQRIGVNQSILKIQVFKSEKEGSTYAIKNMTGDNTASLQAFSSDKKTEKKIASHNFLLTHNQWEQVQEFSLSKDIKLILEN